MRALRFATGSASCARSGVRKPPRSVSSASRSALGRSMRVRSANWASFWSGRAAADRARSVARSGRPAVTAREPRGPARRPRTRCTARRRLPVLDLQLRVGARVHRGQHVPQHPVIEPGHRLHVVRANQVNDVKRAEVQLGERDRRGPDSDAVERIGPGDRAADLRRVGQHAGQPAVQRGLCHRPGAGGRGRGQARLEVHRHPVGQPDPRRRRLDDLGIGRERAARVRVEGRRRPGRSCPARPGARPRRARGRRWRR